MPSVPGSISFFAISGIDYLGIDCLVNNFLVKTVSLPEEFGQERQLPAMPKLLKTAGADFQSWQFWAVSGNSGNIFTRCGAQSAGLPWLRAGPAHSWQ
jgi:hypothetical protein